MDDDDDDVDDVDDDDGHGHGQRYCCALVWRGRRHGLHSHRRGRPLGVSGGGRRLFPFVPMGLGPDGDRHQDGDRAGT